MKRSLYIVQYVLFFSLIFSGCNKSGGVAKAPVPTPVPAISSINPGTGGAGSTVTITGTNFSAVATEDTVRFNNVIASVTSASSTQLVVTVPVSTSGNITVTTKGGISNAVPFAYPTGATVYVLGTDTRYGYGYWINSTFSQMPDCKSAYAMKGAGSDIYIAGPASSQTPTYWKNGTAVQLSSQPGYTYCIFISGTDVYCLGEINGDLNVWKNGVATPLATNSSITTSNSGYYLNSDLSVYNGDTYVAGAQYLGNSNIMKATYWKNGSPVDLTDGITSGSAWANAIFVSGGDVYVAGIEQQVSNNGGIVNAAPRLWKNGVSIPITTPAASIFNRTTSLLVAGSDIYIGGQYNGAGAVWKNGTLLSPSTYNVAETVSSIFLYNNTDLYISGASSSSGNNCYWKNGNFVEMDPGCTGASASCANTFSSQAIAIYVK